MNLYLIRHGESYNNILPVEQRMYDPPLTKNGVFQVKRLAKYFSRIPKHHDENDLVNNNGYRITHLYVSPMIRALETAQFLSNTLNVPIEININLHERGGLYLSNSTQHFGGLSKNEIERDFPNFIIPPSITEKGWWRGGFEDFDAFSIRASGVANFFLDLSKCSIENDYGIGVITHSGLIDALLKRLLNQQITEEIIFETSNTSISRIIINRDNSILICYLNKLEHLSNL